MGRTSSPTCCPPCSALPAVVDGVDGVDGAGACRGRSMLPLLRGEETAQGDEHTLFWEHIGNAALRAGQWKIVREADQEWELYDMSIDRSELHELAAQHPDVVAGLSARWQRWADSVGVIPWPQIKAGARQPAVTALLMASLSRIDDERSRTLPW